MKIIDCFKNEYNSPICIEAEFTGHREVTVGIRSHRSGSSWTITEDEAVHLRDALNTLLQTSIYSARETA